MRILKKSLALLLALTMIASLVVVNVSAADATTKFTLKYGDSVGTATAYKTASLTTVELDLYYTGADGAAYTGGGMNYWIFFDNTLYTEVTFTKGSDFSDMKKQGSLAMGKIGCYLPVDADTGAAEYGPDKKLGTFKFTFDPTALASATEAVFNNATGTGKKSDFTTDDVVDLTDANFTLTLEDAVKLTGIVETVSVTDKKVGTAQNALGLPNEVTATAVKAVGGSAAANVPDVAVTWSGYDPLALTEQHLTGTLTDPDGAGEGVSIASDAVVQATVTLLPLGTEDTEVELTVDTDALEVKEGEVKTADEVAAIVKAAITEIKFKGNGLTRTINKDNVNIDYNKTDAAIAGTELVDDTIAITVEFNGVDSEDGIFDGVVKTDNATIALKVVPAEIAGASVKIEGATTADDMVKVTATLPEADLAYTMDGETKVYTGTFTLAIDEDTEVLGDEDTYDFVIGTDVEVKVEDGVAAVTLTAGEDLSEILTDSSVDAEFTVSVKYNDAALVVGTTEGGANILGVTGKVMAVGGGIDSVPGIGNATNNPAPMTPVTPPTEEPGTEEPGTDEPGTDAPVVEGPFADVAGDHWAAEYITVLKEAGIVGGVNDTDFAPDADITRAEFTKMVAVLFGLEVGAADTHFEDCVADAWYTPYIVAATEAGFINGVSDTAFDPEATITREQACAILARALKATGEGELTFTDAAEVEEYAKAAIAALAEMGLVNGYEDGTFAPKNNITRAEAAKIIAGAYAKVAPAEEAPAEEAPAAE